MSLETRISSFRLNFATVSSCEFPQASGPHRGGHAAPQAGAGALHVQKQGQFAPHLGGVYGLGVRGLGVTIGA